MNGTDAFASQSEFAGYIVRVVVLVPLLLAGTVRAIVLLKRGEANRKCVSSMLTILICFMIAELRTAVRKITPLGPIVAALYLLVAIGGMVASAMLAVQGLLEVAKSHDGRTQGKRQAVVALVLCGFFLVLGTGGLFIKQRGASSAPILQGEQEAPGERIRFEELNFELEVPPSPWARLDVSRMPTDAVVGFLRNPPIVYFMVYAEHMGGIHATSTEMAEIVEARWRASGVVDDLTDDTFSVDGIEGRRLTCRHRDERADSYQAAWVVAFQDRVYSLRSSGPYEQKDAIEQGFKECCGLFHIIDRGP
jgi:hypothetical protein